MAILNKIFSTKMYQATYYVEETHEGMRLDQFLQIYLESWSRQEVKRRIKAKDVVIKDRPGKHRSSTILHYKEEVTFTVHNTTQEDEYWNGELLKKQEHPEILFEDENIVVISKPAYMAAHPTGSHLFYCATVYFGEKYNQTMHSIHRLDRETSGVMLIGKNPDTSNQLGEEFFNDKVRKCYFFIAKEVEDATQDDFFESRERLGPNEDGLKRVYINSHPEQSKLGKRAHTKFKVLHRENGYVLALAFPQTGRQHQIRVHAMVRGLPLLGDKLYLGNFKMFQRFKDKIATQADHDEMEFNRHALHAVALKIRYNGQYKVFRSAIPMDFIPIIENKFTLPIDKINERIKSGVLEYFDSNSDDL
ncbi:RluA family pseudouridine synthase [Halobacteriovorax sp. HLS]|uniref:RluA family pseudouridine synthase n=1 Tax=Halobacteriovorax sp. HLS TaxID=2234000 RepID=UPI000FDB9EED|nr:RluA family pseudouridine synthase [Halobacteriovorax sp. HLS]